MFTSAMTSLSPIAFAHNRRVSTRVAAIVPVELEFTPSTYGVLTARSSDIGMNGICVNTASPIERDAVRLVRFTLGRHQLEFSVSARWSSKAISDAGIMTGFIFDAVDANSESALWRFIQERGGQLALFLQTCNGLGQLDFQEAFELAITTRIHELERGQMIYGGAGTETSTSIFALFRGSVALERASGRRNENFALVKPGELFGGIPIIAGCTSFERAIANENSMVLEFLGYNVEYLISAKPRVGLALMRAATFHWMLRFSRILDQAALQ